MSPATLISRSLRHYWRAHLVLICGVAIAGSVLTGALLIGDSVRASLESLVDERLGELDHVVLTPGHVMSAGLAEQLAEELGEGVRVAPLLRVEGLVSTPSAEGRAQAVTLLGVSPAYFGALGAPEEDISDALLPNPKLSAALGLEPGSELVVRVDGRGSAPLDAPMAVAPMSARAKTIPLGQTIEGRAGLFSLEVHGKAPINALVPIAWLSQLLAPDGRAEGGPRANALLVSGGELSALRPALQARWSLSDMGLTLSERDGTMTLRSDAIMLSDALVEAARPEARGEALTWFVDTIGAGGREVPYSFVSALGGEGSLGLEPGQIALNAWLAEELDASVGSAVELIYPTFGPRRTRGQARRRFTVAKVLPMRGQAVDPELSIHFPGFADARTCRDWEPGVSIDLARIRPQDERYWERYRGAPKAFVSPQDAGEMWRNPYGTLTSLSTDQASALGWRERLPRRVEPSALGVRILGLKEQALAQAKPTTDFAGLFLGLGGLLIISALILSVLLLRLGLIQRGAERRTLFALGFSNALILRLRLTEGLIVVAIGAALGVLGGLGVSEASLQALGGAWQGAIGGLELVSAKTTGSLAWGFIATLFVGALALGIAERGDAEREEVSGGRGALVLSVTCLIIALALLWGFGEAHPAVAYFGAGGLTLVSGLTAAFALLCRPSRGAPMSTLWGLAWRNLSRRPRASIAASAVLAAGTFIVVGVGVSRHDASSMTERASGTGGFALVAESSLPLAHTLDSEAGLEAYGLTRADLKGANVLPLRVRPGDDASCLNLAEAPRPALYGVSPEAMGARGAFGDAALWSRLGARGELSDSGLPLVAAIGDVATLTWRLKLSLGDEIQDIDERGEAYVLRIVGVLPTSILQGGLLVDAEVLAERFPTGSGDRLFLIDAPGPVAGEVAALLDDALFDSGFVSTPAVEVLGRYLRVENTYLAIFMSLGGLGLLLGAPGVGLLLFRRVLSRRRELNLLYAMGWRRSEIRRVLILEHGAIVAIGVGVGGLAASLAVIPALGSSVTREPVTAALLLGGAVFVMGLLGVGGATRLALGGALTEALSEEP